MEVLNELIYLEFIKILHRGCVEFKWSSSIFSDFVKDTRCTKDRKNNMRILGLADKCIGHRRKITFNSAGCVTLLTFYFVALSGLGLARCTYFFVSAPKNLSAHALVHLRNIISHYCLHACEPISQTKIATF